MGFPEKFAVTGKKALVTGAGRGIGRATALALAEAGADVVIADIMLDNAQKVADEIVALGRKSLALKVDYSHVESIEEMVDEVIKQWGRIDILVNNAGVLQSNNLYNMTEKDWDWLTDIDLKGSFFCVRKVFVHMKENGGGRIVSLASVAGKTGGMKAAPHYAISKAGVVCFTKTFAKNGGPFNVLVNAVAPGYHLTDMTKDSHYETLIDTVPIGRLGTPEDVADVILFLCSEASRYMTGLTLDINGGIYMY